MNASNKYRNPPIMNRAINKGTAKLCGNDLKTPRRNITGIVARKIPRRIFIYISRMKCTCEGAFWDHQMIKYDVIAIVAVIDMIAIIFKAKISLSLDFLIPYKSIPP